MRLNINFLLAFKKNDRSSRPMLYGRMLTITNTDHLFTLTEPQCIDLELKLNVTSKGKEWVHIGDHLFAYGTKKPIGDRLVVNNDQYEFLQKLLTKSSYRECRDL